MIRFVTETLTINTPPKRTLCFSPVHLEVLGQELKSLILVLFDPHNIVDHLKVKMIRVALSSWSFSPGIPPRMWKASQEWHTCWWHGRWHMGPPSSLRVSWEEWPPSLCQCLRRSKTGRGNSWCITIIQSSSARQRPWVFNQMFLWIQTSHSSKNRQCPLLYCSL